MIRGLPQRAGAIAAVAALTWLAATLMPAFDVRLLAALSVALQVFLVSSSARRLWVEVLPAGIVAALTAHFGANVLGPAYDEWRSFTARALFPALIALIFGAIALFDTLNRPGPAAPPARD